MQTTAIAIAWPGQPELVRTVEAGYANAAVSEGSVVEAVIGVCVARAIGHFSLSAGYGVAERGTLDEMFTPASEAVAQMAVRLTLLWCVLRQYVTDPGESAEAYYDAKGNAAAPPDYSKLLCYAPPCSCKA